MAIFNINESTLNSFLIEHGGAHRKYAELKQSQADYHENRAKELDQKSKDQNISFNKAAKAKEQKISHLNKASNLQDKADSYNTSNITKDYNKAKQQDKNSAMNIYQKAGANMKKDFQSKYGGSSKSTINTNDRKPGTYLK